MALRKVRGLIECGASVEVISPELCPGLEELAENGMVLPVRRLYQEGDLEGAFMVISATDDRQLNEEIAREANAAGMLVNVVDVPDLCNFIVPSCVRRGNLTISISTGGASPALARKLRTNLEKVFGEGYGELARIIGEVRWELRGSGVSVPAEAWQDALDLDRLLELIRKGHHEEAKRELLQKLREKRV